MKILVRDPINLTQLVLLNDVPEGCKFKYEFQRQPNIDDLAIFKSKEEAEYAVNHLAKDSDSLIMISYIEYE